MDSFGETIRDLREMRGWTMAELGRRSGIDPATIGKVENGHLPTMSTAVKLADGFGLPLWKIIRDAEEAGVVAHG